MDIRSSPRPGDSNVGRLEARGQEGPTRPPRPHLLLITNRSVVGYGPLYHQDMGNFQLLSRSSSRKRQAHRSLLERVEEAVFCVLR